MMDELTPEELETIKACQKTFSIGSLRKLNTYKEYILWKIEREEKLPIKILENTTKNTYIKVPLEIKEARIAVALLRVEK